MIDDVTQAGFRLAGQGGSLRSSEDTRDWNSSSKAGEKRGTSDRFALEFVKPRRRLRSPAFSEYLERPS